MSKVVVDNLDFLIEDMTSLSNMFEGVYWCKTCQIPLLEKECSLCNKKAVRCAKDLKPVFGKERHMFEGLVGKKLPSFMFINRNYVSFNGKSLFSFSTNPYEGLKIAKNYIKELENYEDIIYQENYAKLKWELCFKANKFALEKIENEAIEFIRRISNVYPSRERIISLSGGKDSTVTALLVKKAIGIVPIVFGDTSIEYEDTYSYVNQFVKEYGFQLFTGKPDDNFLDLCQQLGPPSRIMRWCCTVCKSRSINKFYNTLDKDILCFDGIRRMESTRRTNYPRIVQVHKLSKQVSARPIVDWSSFAVWLYILSKQILYNPLYDYGFSRVGCVYCPSNSFYNEYLTKINFPEIYYLWENFLLKYAIESGKVDPKSYVTEGFWKRRNITKERNFVVEPNQPCDLRNEIVYHFDVPYSAELVEFFKPFGKLSLIENDDVTSFLVGRGNPLLITGTLGDTQLNVTFGEHYSYKTRLQVERQIERFLNCVHCGGCAGVCPRGAIRIEEGNFMINNYLCVKCGRCLSTKYLKAGCVALNFGTKKKSIRR